MKTANGYKYEGPNGQLVSRQRIWQLKQTAKGLCIKCNSPLFNNTVYCRKHYESHLAQKRILDRERYAETIPILENKKNKTEL